MLQSMRGGWSAARPGSLFKRVLGCCLLACLLAGGVLLPLACAGKSKPEKLHEQGALLYKHRKYYKAIELFEQALAIEPERPRTMTMLADAYLRTNKPETALTFADKVLAKEPDNNEAALIKGQAHLALAQREGEMKDGRMVYDQAQLDSAAKIASELRKKNPNLQEGMLLQAEVDILNNHLDSAERLYRATLEQSPKEERAQLGLIRVLMMQRKFPEAEQLAKTGLAEHEGQDPQMLTQLATSQYLQKKFDEAWATLEPAVAESNKDPDIAHYLLAGQILLAHIDQLRGVSNEATTTDTAAIQHPALAALGQPKGESEANSAEMKRVVDQLASLGSVMKGRYPTRPESFYLRAISYQLQGDRNNALKHFQEAVSRDPRGKIYRLALATSYMDQKDFNLAREELRNLLKTYPGDYDARLRMAQCYALEQNFEEALDILRSLMLEKPEDRTLKDVMGRILVLSDRPEEVERGLQLLGESAGPAGLAPGGREFVLAQAAMREAAQLNQDGKTREAAQQYQQAEELLRQAVDSQPGNYLAELNLSELAGLRGDLFTALAHAHRAATLDAQFRPVEARLFARLGQYAAARKIYEEMLQANPNAISTELALAELETSMKDYSAALHRYDRIIEKFPTDPRGVIGKAQVMTGMQGLPAAADFLRQQQPKFADAVSVRLLLSRFAIQLNQPQEAATLLGELQGIIDSKLQERRAQGMTDDQVKASRAEVAPALLELAIAQMLLGKNDEALKNADDALALAPVTAPEANMLRAVAMIRLGKSAEATSLIDDLPNDRRSLQEIAPMVNSVAKLSAGQTEEALAAVEKASALNPEALRLYRDLLTRAPKADLQKLAPDLALQVYLSYKQLYAQPSLALTEASLKIVPDAPFLLARKAEAYQMLGQAEPALAAYDALEKQMPDFAPVRLAKADIHLAQATLAALKRETDTRLTEVTQAEDLLRAARKLDPTNRLALEKLAEIHQGRDELDEANVLYREILKLDPQNYAAHNNLAWNLARLNKLDEAAAAGQEALKAAGDHGGVIDTVGWIEFQRGNLPQAEELLRRASRLAPNNPDIRYHFAQICEKQGKPREAAQALESLMLATPDFEKIGEVRAMLARLAPQSPLLAPAASQAAPTTATTPTSGSTVAAATADQATTTTGGAKP